MNLSAAQEMLPVLHLAGGKKLVFKLLSTAENASELLDPRPKLADQWTLSKGRVF